MHYQICAHTCMYYFAKIMNIMPKNRDKWVKSVRIAHNVVTFVLFTCFGYAIMKDIFEGKHDIIGCRDASILIFQIVILSIFIFFGIMLRKIRKRISGQ